MEPITAKIKQTNLGADLIFIKTYHRLQRQTFLSDNAMTFKNHKIPKTLFKKEFLKSQTPERQTSERQTPKRLSLKDKLLKDKLL